MLEALRAGGVRRKQCHGFVEIGGITGTYSVSSGCRRTGAELNLRKLGKTRGQRDDQLAEELMYPGGQTLGPELTTEVQLKSQNASPCPSPSVS